MIRPLGVALAAVMALVTAAASGAGEAFPVVHNEPITVRIVGGKDGQPLGRLHLTLIAGYDESDMRDQLFREEVLTDARGQARLSNQLANLPWLQVWVGGKPLCQAHPRTASFSVDLIRRDGLSTPNRCGKAMGEDKPGVFTVFVKGNGVAPAAVFVAPIVAAAPAAGTTGASISAGPVVPGAAEVAPALAAVPASALPGAVPVPEPVTWAALAPTAATCACAVPKKVRRCGPVCIGAKTVRRGIIWYFH